MVSFFKIQTLLWQKQINFAVQGTAEISQGDKMFKILSRPQINLEDMMKLEK
jgi:tRNA uridine 5-carboxymethylaminomethyl modification enzyme